MYAAAITDIRTKQSFLARTHFKLFVYNRVFLRLHNFTIQLSIFPKASILSICDSYLISDSVTLSLI